MNRREFLLAAASAAVASRRCLSPASCLPRQPARRAFYSFSCAAATTATICWCPTAAISTTSRARRWQSPPRRQQPKQRDRAGLRTGASIPVLRDSIYPLWQRKQIAFVPFAGTDDLSRSHFETQDNIESRSGHGSHRQLRSGFLARLSGSCHSVPPSPLPIDLPLSFQGAGKDVPNISLKGDTNSHFDARQSAILSRHVPGHAAGSATADGLELPQDVSQDLRDEMARPAAARPARNFANETQRIATLMRDQYRLASSTSAAGIPTSIRAASPADWPTI
jgi:uncharacterized protein (DUF1501 family)